MKLLSKILSFILRHLLWMPRAILSIMDSGVGSNKAYQKKVLDMSMCFVVVSGIVAFVVGSATNSTFMGSLIFLILYVISGEIVRVKISDEWGRVNF